MLQHQQDCGSTSADLNSLAICTLRLVFFCLWGRQSSVPYSTNYYFFISLYSDLSGICITGKEIEYWDVN